jgi:hypothetical protein
LSYEGPRAFRRLIEIELAGSRESDQRKYNDIAHDMAFWMRLSPHEVSPLNLAGELPPPWVAAIPDLAFLWERGAAAYRERPELRRTA